ncbi:MAG: ABC transporter substrate-binding protein [Aphanothece sp. CMT-3BRIN-NPC111]|nr:ABC transporter substrate-binding protein [Aphanothece sp. CMT-3BRIN-NPC111]
MVKQSTNLSRRQFLFTAGATTIGALLLKGCTTPSSNSTNASPKLNTFNVNPGLRPETTSARIGFVGQTDAAPLVIAKVKNLFAKYGVPDVQLAKQPSWGVTRDNLQLGSKGGGVDGAMVLSPMAYQMALGTATVNNKKIPMYVLARMNTGGQGISVSNVHKDVDVRLDSRVLKSKVEQAKAAGEPLRFGMTFKGGTSDVMLRYWLAAGGIDPDKDVSVLVVPGSQLVANVKIKNLDGFCVGDPWHVRLINQKLGYTATTTDEFWADHPEKALSFRGDWVDKHPNTSKAILMAVMEAQQWCDKMENRAEMAQIISDAEWAKVPVQDISDRLKGRIDYGNNRTVMENSPYRMRYWENHASYPYKSHDLWFLTENLRWGQMPANLDTQQIINAVNREDLWREAAAELGLTESQIPQSTSRGVEKFFDGVTFDPNNPTAYLQSLQIKHV